MEPCPPTALAIAFAGVVVYGGKSLGAVAGSVQAADQFSASLFVQMEKMILPNLILLNPFEQTKSRAHRSIWEINPSLGLGCCYPILTRSLGVCGQSIDFWAINPSGWRALEIHLSIYQSSGLESLVVQSDIEEVE